MRKIIVALGLVAGFSAQAQTYKPDFDCQKANLNDSIAVMLCQNSDAAKAELEFDQAYYALRHVVGKSGWKPLKQEAIKDDEAFSLCINTASEGASTPPAAQPGCYISTMAGLTEKYRHRLSGPALQEAARSIDEHIALQQKLIDLGYLPEGTRADGVYGEGTRQAIETWQRVSHRPSTDGFLSDDDALMLLASSNPSPIDTESVRTDASSPQKNYNFISSACPDGVTVIQGILFFDDPYSIKGKCFSILISSRFGRKQWIDENTVLIIDSMPFSPSQVSTTIVHDDQGHIKYGSTAIVKGSEPITYTSALGERIVAPTLNVIQYTNDPYSDAGIPVKARLEYPEEEREKGISGDVTISCYMHQQENKLWKAQSCDVMNYTGSQNFINSSMKYMKNSTWSNQEVYGQLSPDKKFSKTMHFHTD